MRVELATIEDRENLALLRAEEWRGPLSTQQFSQRNRLLYGHPYAAQMKTFLLRSDRGEIVTSLDALRVSLLDYSGKFSGLHFAFVITPKVHRGKGYSTKLLTHVLENEAWDYSVLYSDIPMTFYERLGFRGRPVSVVERSASTGQMLGADSLNLSQVVHELTQYRKKEIIENNAAILPDPLFLDWHLERFRFFASESGRKLSNEMYWCLQHSRSHPLIAVPNYIWGTLDALWVVPDCQLCLTFLANLAAKHKLGSFRYWASELLYDAPKREQPMIRKKESAKEVQFTNPQWCDWW